MPPKPPKKPSSTVQPAKLVRMNPASYTQQTVLPEPASPSVLSKREVHTAYITTHSEYPISITNPVKGRAMHRLIAWTIRQCGGTVMEEDTISVIADVVAKRHVDIYKVLRPFTLMDEDQATAGYPVLIAKFTGRVTGLDDETDEILDFGLMGRHHSIGMPPNPHGYTHPSQVIHHSKDIEDMKRFLLDGRYIAPPPDDLSMRKRVDLWQIVGYAVLLYESKNVEVTGVQYIHLLQLLLYGLGIDQMGILDEAGAKVRTRLIYNGHYDERYTKLLNRWSRIYGLRLDMLSIRDWLDEFSRRTGRRITLLEASSRPLFGCEMTPMDMQVEGRDLYLSIKTEEGSTAATDRVFLNIPE